jgi:hypothetical protein
MLLGPGREKAKVHVKYNVSGVDSEEDLAFNPLITTQSFPCQYISGLTVISTDDNAKLILRLPYDITKPFYTSELNGKGQIVYKKGMGGGAAPIPSPSLQAQNANATPPITTGATPTTSTERSRKGQPWDHPGALNPAGALEKLTTELNLTAVLTPDQQTKFASMQAKNWRAGQGSSAASPSAAATATP